MKRLSHALVVLLLAAGCHDAPTPSAVPSAVNPIVPPFASGLIEESSESGAAALPDGFEDGTALITSYRNRLNRNPQDLEALILLGNASYDIGSYAEAEDLYRRALTIDPEHTQARTDLATALHRQGKSLEAIDELQRVLVIDYQHENALYNLGLLKLRVRDDREGAIRAWEQLAESTEDQQLAAEVREMIVKVQAAPPVPSRRPAGPVK
jgi:cytochrome c-type biogenesis protein CcmH/NrfG